MFIAKDSILLLVTLTKTGVFVLFYFVLERKE